MMPMQSPKYPNNDRELVELTLLSRFFAVIVHFHVSVTSSSSVISLNPSLFTLDFAPKKQLIHCQLVSLMAQGNTWPPGTKGVE
jgi:hypothetical protein